MTDVETTAHTGDPEEKRNSEPLPQVPPVPVVPAAPSAAPVPISHPLPPPTQAPPPEKDKNDIERLLAEVKLPEQRDFKASADIPTQKPAEEASIIEEHIVKSAAVRKQEINTTANETQPHSADYSSAVVPLRTLKEDMESVVREKKISLVRAASLEEEKKHGQEHLAQEQVEIQGRRSRRTLGVLFASGILVLLGIGALLGVFIVMNEQAAAPVAPTSSILFSEQTVTFALDGQTALALKNGLASASQKQLGQLGSITRVIPTVSTSTNGSGGAAAATLSQFFTALGINPPQELMGAIGPDFFFGFHVVDTNAPLFVIPVTSYDHAFAGMLAWEPTMDEDLSPIFNSVSPTKLDASGVPQTRTFEDDVLRNYDVRELKDDSGNVVLYYSFPTPKILIIAQSPYSFTEILSRLQANREL